MNEVESLFAFVCFHDLLLKDVNESLSKWSVNKLYVQIKNDLELKELAFRCANLIDLNRREWVKDNSNIIRALNHETDAYAWFSGTPLDQIKAQQIKYLLTSISDFQNSVMNYNLKNLKF